MLNKLNKNSILLKRLSIPLLKWKEQPIKHYQINFIQHYSQQNSYESSILSHDIYFSKEKGTNKINNLIILHGLFGSKQNWSSLARAFERKLQTNVITVDLRNHGQSFHSEDMSYEAMANDVKELIHKKGLSDEKNVIMGHSMGGRVAMHLLLNKGTNQLFSKGVIVDVGPFKMDLGNTFQHYIKVMQQIELQNYKKQSEADNFMLNNNIQDIRIRQFLLTNYKKQPNGVYQFRNPLKVLLNSLNQLRLLDENLLQHSTRIPTLFIRGTQSNYLPKGIEKDLKPIFLNSVIKDIEAGHWVHAERSNEFLDEVIQFLK